MKGILFFVAVLAATMLLNGCATSGSSFQYQSASAGRIGCPAGEVTITNIERPGGIIIPSRSWVANCNGQTYYCSGLFNTKSGVHDVSCAKKSNGSEVAKKQENSNSKKRRPPHK